MTFDEIVNAIYEQVSSLTSKDAEQFLRSLHCSLDSMEDEQLSDAENGGAFV